MNSFLFPTYNCIYIHKVKTDSVTNNVEIIDRLIVNELAELTSTEITHRINQFINSNSDINIYVGLNRDKQMCNKIIEIINRQSEDSTQTLFTTVNCEEIKELFKNFITTSPKQVIYLPNNPGTFVEDIKTFLDVSILPTYVNIKEWYNNFYFLLLDSIYWEYVPHIIKLFPIHILNDFNFFLNCFNKELNEESKVWWYRFDLSKFHFILSFIKVSIENQYKILQFLDDDVFSESEFTKSTDKGPGLDKHMFKRFWTSLTEDKLINFMDTITTYAKNCMALSKNPFQFKQYQFDNLIMKITSYISIFNEPFTLKDDEKIEISKYEEYITFCLTQLNLSKNP